MKTLMFQGIRVQTTDEIADAVITYARMLAEAGQVDIVEFPSIVDGQFAHCAMLVGGSFACATASMPEQYPQTLQGADLAYTVILDRIDAVQSRARPE